MSEYVIEYILAFMFISLFGSFTIVLMTFAWSMFEDTKLGQILIEKIKSWFGEKTNDEAD